MVDINAAIDISPRDAGYLSQRGFYLEKLDRCQEAMKDYEDSIKLEPKNSRLYLPRAYLRETFECSLGLPKNVTKK